MAHLKRKTTTRPLPADPATLSVLDGGGAVDHAFDVTFGGGGSWACVIDGMGIQNFKADGGGSAESGAGIIVSGGQTVIRNCRFASNTAAVDGGGIFFWSVYWADSLVENCVFTGNTAGGIGGAIAFDYGLYSAVTVSNCDFENNSAGLGGAISHYYGTVTVDVAASRFTGNTATSASGAFGGAVYIEGADADYTNCVFHDNGDYYAGGVYILLGMGGDTATSYLVNCTFANSQVAAHYSGATAYVRNCIAYDHAEALGAWDGTINVWDSCVQGGAYSDIDGSITSDPLFADSASGDLRIRGGSPSLDVADAGWAPAADARGIARPVGAGPDMGAYEFFGPGTPALDAASDTGAASDDNVTAATTPTFEGTGVDGTTVTLWSDVDGALGTGVVSGGAWSVTASLMSEGVHEVTATATDAGGAVDSVASEALTVTIDTTSPNCIAITPDHTLVAGAVTFTVVFDSDVYGFDAQSDLVIVSSGITLGTVTVSAVDARTYTAAFTGILGSGTLTVRVDTASDVADLAGNGLTSSVVSAEVTVDDSGDMDNDGMPDYWEELHGLDPRDPSDAHEDADGDGVSNLDEYLQGTDPRDPTDSPGRLPAAGAAGLAALAALLGGVALRTRTKRGPDC